jgi:spore maturation protein CgeB
MRVAIFCHSFLSDWSNGDAHFIRGIATELAARGHVLRVFEPKDAWSAACLVEERGAAALERTRAAYPLIDPQRYDASKLVLDDALDGTDLVIVHEWTHPDLVKRIGDHRRRARYRLLFHDTHHRAISHPDAMSAFDLSSYDGVLACGEVLRDAYSARGWAARAFAWYHAADVRLFRPPRGNSAAHEGDLVWIGNFGDEERGHELAALVVRPCDELGLRAKAFGVRYPDHMSRRLRRHGIEHGGWLPNYQAPQVFTRFKLTVHVPRRPHAVGVPSIRPFEALACGVPLVCAPWEDVDGLFTPGDDYLVARSGAEMVEHARALINDAAMRKEFMERGIATIMSRHTCGHRVDDLLEIARALGVSPAALAPAAKPARGATP